MAIVIKKILNIVDEKWLLAEVQHYEEVFEVFLCGEIDVVKSSIGKDIFFEMEYGNILSCKLLQDNDDNHGLFNNRDSVIIRGKVHNKIQMDNDTIIDIYIWKGPEFISILSSEINEFIPEIGDFIELNIEGLRVYLTDY